MPPACAPLATSVPIIIYLMTFVRYCGQRPSLLWTSALRPNLQYLMTDISQYERQVFICQKQCTKVVNYSLWQNLVLSEKLLHLSALHEHCSHQNLHLPVQDLPSFLSTSTHKKHSETGL